MLTGTSARPKGSIGEAELAEGLMLVRASTLKMLRLQLAMERRDRRSAIAALDELLEIDRSLAECLPIARLDDERAALNREKLTLAAQVITRDAWAEPEPQPVEFEPEPWDSGAWEEAVAAPTSQGRRPWWLVGLSVVLVATAVAVVLLGVPAEIARFAPNLGGVL